MNTAEQVTYLGKGYSSEFEIISEALNELSSARRQYPKFPTDIVLATVVMVEESTEALKAANEIRWKHKGTTLCELRNEVIQTIAMCLRLLTEQPDLVDSYNNKAVAVEPSLAK